MKSRRKVSHNRVRYETTAMEEVLEDRSRTDA
jgi:hypothetical protein